MLNFLGRGAAFYTKEANTSAYFIWKQKFFLIDCGETVFSKLQEKNLLEHPLDVYAIITHLHADHVGSLPTLISYCFLKLHKKINVIHPNPKIVELLKIMGVSPGFYNYDPVAEPMKEWDDIAVEFIKAGHVDDMECYSLKLEIGGCKLYYSGDSGVLSGQMVEQLANREIDVLYQDTCKGNGRGGSHLSLRRLKEMVPEGGLRGKVYCMHLDSDFTDEINEAGFKVVSID